MRQAVETVMARYGTDMVLVRGQTQISVRGFFQAVNATSWQSIESQATLLGEITRGQYVYLGPVSAGAREGDVLKLGVKSYLLRRVEPYYYGNEAVYQWGLCVEKGVNDTGGTQS